VGRSLDSAAQQYGPGVEDSQVLSARLDAVCERVEEACRVAGRDRADVRILLATKTQSAELVRQVLGLPAAAEMLRGENRVQELVAKGPALADLSVVTHLIGPLQSNKINAALRWISGAESVASLELAEKLSARLESGRVLDVMVQVNVSAEPTKSGVMPSEALKLAGLIASLPGLSLTGFMTVGANSTDLSRVRAGYAELAAIRDQALAAGVAERLELSMGMSHDLEAAIAEGATIVRIGTAVFGARSPIVASTSSAT
jgi:PLP dependent protein